MNKILASIIILPTLFLLSGCGKNPAVKKSETGICHEEGTNYYKNTKNFTAYSSVEKCLKDGGRLPKK